MNLGPRLVAILAAAAALMPSVSNIRPAGCVTPDILAKSLKAVTDRDWNDVDEKKLQSIWPSEIGGIECTAGACQTIGRRDRVINDECQCCELFGLNIERNDKGEVTSERLHSIVFYYSAVTRGELLDDAKILARAMGLPDSDAATLGSKRPQDFNWVADKAKKQEITLLDVRFYHQDGMWTAYFHLSRQRL
jgi:hypothetical protein